MDTTEMEHFAEKHKQISKHFAGVFPANLLPDRRIVKFPSYFIVNTCTTFDSIFLDAIQEIGCHWICIVVDKFETTLFDSSGQKFHKTDPYISKFLINQRKPIKSSSTIIQPVLSNLCGIYVLAFLSSVSKGSNLKRFLNQFEKKSEKLYKNDKIVKTIFKKSFL